MRAALPGQGEEMARSTSNQGNRSDRDGSLLVSEPLPNLEHDVYRALLDRLGWVQDTHAK